jgi:hypothetical protein
MFFLFDEPFYTLLNEEIQEHITWLLGIFIVFPIKR